MKLVWDKVGEHFYETGVDHGVLYNYDKTAKAFASGVAWNGLTAVNEQPSGAEPSPIYADNIKYLNLMSAEEYAATIEAVTFPKEFEKCDGFAEVAPGVTIGQQNREMFGFCYRTLMGSDTEGTALGYKLHIVYNATASPSERAHSTVNDNPETASFSWSISTTPVEVPGYKPTATLEFDSTRFTTEEAKAKLTALEDILYGTDEAEPRLPYPTEIIRLMGNAANPNTENTNTENTNTQNTNTQNTETPADPSNP